METKTYFFRSSVWLFVCSRTCFLYPVHNNKSQNHVNNIFKLFIIITINELSLANHGELCNREIKTHCPTSTTITRVRSSPLKSNQSATIEKCQWWLDSRIIWTPRYALIRTDLCMTGERVHFYVVNRAHVHITIWQVRCEQDSVE